MWQVCCGRGWRGFALAPSPSPHMPCACLPACLPVYPPCRPPACPPACLQSQQPLTLPPGLLIFNDIRLRGFWLTGGYAKVGGAHTGPAGLMGVAAAAEAASACLVSTLVVPCLPDGPPACSPSSSDPCPPAWPPVMHCRLPLYTAPVHCCCRR